MKRKRMLIAIAGGAAFLLGFLSSIRSAPAQQRFDMRVRNDFFAGFSGDKEALARGMKVCEDALAGNPKDAEAMVWHGAGVLFEAGQSFQAGNQAKGGELWARGMKEMQTAVDIAPDALGVRLPRGAVLLTASRSMPLEQAKPLIETGLADFARAYDLQKENFDTLGAHSRGELLFGLAEGYSRVGDQTKAAEFFEKIRTDLPGTIYAKRADLWTQNKTLPVSETGCVGCHVGK